MTFYEGVDNTALITDQEKEYDLSPEIPIADDISLINKTDILYDQVNNVSTNINYEYVFFN